MKQNFESSDGAGWSKPTNFSTPPAVGASSVRVVIYGDMGKAERDNATIHYSTVRISILLLKL